MARNPFRLPKDTPRDVLRAVFRGRKYPKSGQFLSSDDAFRVRDALLSYYEPTPRRHKTTKPAPPSTPAPKPKEPERAEERGVLEWEVGIDYHAAVRTSNVAFNARFYREDGGLMTEDDARDVLRHIIYTGQAPQGIAVQEVYWQRSRHGRKRYGRTSDMTAFYDILSAVGDVGMETTPLRLGAVKRDEL